MLKNLLKKIIPEPLLKAYHYCLAFLGAFFYKFPAKELMVVGVTGTSGKSTVVELTSYILKQAGLKTASMSSITFKFLKMTMPGRFKIQKFLRKAAKEGCKYVVLEVTSEGIKQYRHKFIDFKIAVFTNLSKEHIESHKGFENYRKAKAELFRTCKDTHIINLDDENSGFFWQIPAKNKIGFSRNEFSKFLPENMNMLGEFNKYNALTATKIAMALGVSQEICRKAVKDFKGIEGRMEIMNKDPLVIVDYAHTPEALKQVYETLNSKLKTQNSKLICVLGSCGGGRDKWKRPVLGKIAAEYCQKVIVTNEDPYDEDPMEIINQVAENTNAEKILDRKEAIKKAIFLAGLNDTVIITGKGSEPWMCVKNNKKIPWDDREVARQELSIANK